MEATSNKQATDATKTTLLLTVPEAARLLKLGRNRVYEMTACGRIPSIRIGSTIRIPRVALERWVEAELAAVA